MSQCPVKLDSDEACLIAADWYEEQGDTERAERMRAVLSFKFGDRVLGWVPGPQGKLRVELVVVGRTDDCLHVLAMRDKAGAAEVKVFPPDGLKRRRERKAGPPSRWEQGNEALAARNREALSHKVGELVRYRRGATGYLARVVGYSRHEKGRRGVLILPLPEQGQEVSIRSAGPTCLSRVSE